MFVRVPPCHWHQLSHPGRLCAPFCHRPTQYCPVKEPGLVWPCRHHSGSIRGWDSSSARQDGSRLGGRELLPDAITLQWKMKHEASWEGCWLLALLSSAGSASGGWGRHKSTWRCHTMSSSAPRLKESLAGCKKKIRQGEWKKDIRFCCRLINLGGHQYLGWAVFNSSLRGFWQIDSFFVLSFFSEWDKSAPVQSMRCAPEVWPVPGPAPCCPKGPWKIRGSCVQQVCLSSSNGKKALHLDESKWAFH